MTTAQKLKFSIKDFFSKCDQIRTFQRIWSHLLKKSLMENFSFCVVDRNGNNIINSTNYKSLINDNPVIQLGSVVSVLKRLRSNHPQQIIIGHLNINSIRNKFDIMKPMLMHDLDIFMVTETKLDDSFPVSQFNVEGFSTPFRLDRNKTGGRIILYIRSYIIASKLTSFTFPNDIEAFFIEINLKGNK